MKKIITALLCFTITTTAAQASIIKIGARAGAGLSYLNVATDSSAYKNLNLKSDLGYQVGAFGRFNLLLFHIQPEILLTGFGATYGPDKQATQLSFKKVDISALGGFSFLLGLVRCQIGPVGSFLLKAVKESKSIKNGYTPAALGYQAGFGVDLLDIAFDIRYTRNLTQFGTDNSNIGTNHGYGLLMFSIGVNLFKLL
ncbi:MAG: outer membrane beta-barrel protein [Bacteroidota bacterium]